MKTSTRRYEQEPAARPFAVAHSFDRLSLLDFNLFSIKVKMATSESKIDEKPVTDGLKKLAEKESFRLRVIGTPSYECPPVDVEAMRWRADTELEDLSEIDIGMMPLPDDRWSKGKCGLKALQFMALGIPTICSPVGVNTDIIQDDQNGFIAGTEDEWVEKLTRLLRSAELRRRLGDAGRATVEEKYSAITQTPRVYEIFKSVLRDVSVPVDARVQSRSAG